MTKPAPSIEKIQYCPDIDFEFDVDNTEYYVTINHDGPAVRIVLENDNWIEYRKLDDETMNECVFVQHQHPDGQYESVLEDSTKVKHLEIETVEDFFKTVAVSIEFYQRDIETLEDAASSCSTIVPALEEA